MRLKDDLKIFDISFKYNFINYLFVGKPNYSRIIQ